MEGPFTPALVSRGINWLASGLYTEPEACLFLNLHFLTSLIVFSYCFHVFLKWCVVNN